MDVPTTASHPLPPAEEPSLPTEEDWFDRLSVKAVKLIDAIEVYKNELESAKATHPNEVDISDIEGKINAFIKKFINTSEERNMQTTPENVTMHQNTTATKDGVAHSEGVEKSNMETIHEHVSMQQKNNATKDWVEHSEDYNDVIDQHIIDHVEILEYLHSSQGRRDAEAFDDEFSSPRFSLGIEDHNNPVLYVCQEINKEHGALSNIDQEGHKNVFVTPVTQKEKRPKRDAKLAAAYLSPYVQRHIDINAKYSTQEYAVYRWLIQIGKDPLEHVFDYGQQFCIREHVMTMKDNEMLYYSLIDVWAILLNDKEKYKAPESSL